MRGKSWELSTDPACRMMSYGIGCQGVHFFGLYTAQYNKMPEANTFEESLLSNIAFIAAGQRWSPISGAPANMNEQQFQISQRFMLFYDQ